MFVYVCLCPPSRLLITSGMIWSLYEISAAAFQLQFMAFAINSIYGHGLQPKKTKVMLY